MRQFEHLIHHNAVEVESGKNYYWCSCGKSGKQPFCDGSHGGTGFYTREVHGNRLQESVFLWLQIDSISAYV